MFSVPSVCLSATKIMESAILKFTKLGAEMRKRKNPLHLGKLKDRALAVMEDFPPPSSL